MHIPHLLDRSAIHPVDLNGNIARLENVETPHGINKSAVQNDTQVGKSDEIDPNNPKKRKHAETSDSNPPESAENPKNAEDEPTKDKSGTDWDSLHQDLSKLVDETPAYDVVSFLRGHEASSEESDKKFYTLPVISDKQKRRSVHVLLKSPAFTPVAIADTQEGRIRIWHRKFAGDMPVDTFTGVRGGNQGGNRNNSNNNGGRGGGGGGVGGRNNNKSNPWPKDRPDFLRFVLYKENIDTSTAAKDVTRMARLNPKRGIGYAGMKDKRGVTSQFCSVYRVEKEQLLAVNKGHEEAGNAGGGNSSLRGTCVIRLGNLEYSSDEAKLGTLTGNRFDIVLRNVDVGERNDSNTDADVTSEIELVRQKLETAAMSLQKVGFINYFGMQRFGKSNDTHEVGIAILKGDFETAINIIMREKVEEQNQRIMEARVKWAKRFEGIDVKKDDRSAKDAEVKCARAILQDMGRFMVCEKSIVTTLSRKPRDYKRAFGSIAKNMRSMFLHAYQSYLWNKVASHRIETGGSTEVRVGDLILIEDKSLGEGGGGTSGLKGKAVKVLEEQDVKDGKYDISDVVLPLVGSKISYPKGVSGAKFDELLNQDGISKSDFAKIGAIDREISLGGDYRKLLCKPSDVSFEIKAYHDPVQPLIQTDLMKVTGTQITATTISSNEEKPTDDPLTKSEVVGEDAGNPTIFGMVIGFTLPPSAYATIALRELTKRPTSSDYQSKLELSGKCERNLVDNEK